MANYLVSLNVISSRHYLVEISNALGMRHAKDSCEKGAPIPSPLDVLQKRFSSTCWRLESGIRKNASLDKHLDALMLKLPSDFPERIHHLKLKKAPVVSIGVFTERLMKSLSLSQTYMKKFEQFGFDLKITFYNTRQENP